MAKRLNRSSPNILIVGTPATGKTCIADHVSLRTGLRHINVGHYAVDHKFIEGHDDEFGCEVLDEDRLLDALENEVSAGGCILDYHSASLFPERWIDGVFVIRTDNSVLYDRLSARGYSGTKLDNNMECEIMCVLADEARESYRPELLFELQNDTREQLEQNVARVCEWFAQWRAAHHPSAGPAGAHSATAASSSASAPDAASDAVASARAPDAPPATKRRAH